MKVGDKVKVFLDQEIEKAESAKKNNPYVSSSVLELWHGLNGRTGIIYDMVDDDVWVKGPQGVPRLFNRDVLLVVD